MMTKQKPPRQLAIFICRRLLYLTPAKTSPKKVFQSFIKALIYVSDYGCTFTLNDCYYAIWKVEPQITQLQKIGNKRKFVKIEKLS